MTKTRPSAVYLTKAERALAGASQLLLIKDTEGSCSRAYYAMFDAARAALLTAGGPSEITSKTHSGLIAAFGRNLVSTGLVDAAFGRALNQVQELRLIADYTGDPISLEKAEWAVAQAGMFIDAMRALVRSRG